MLYCIRCRGKSGAILLISLWTLFLLTILTLGISSRVASEIGFAKFLDERVISLYLAKAAVTRAVLELEKDDDLGCDTLYELRRMREIELGGGKLSFNLLDEERLININAVTPDIIARLPGLTAELANDIYMRRLKKPFVLKEELLLQDGLTPEIYAQFKELVTAFGAGWVNINTASPDVLKILGLQDDLIDAILVYRRGDDGREDTEDDGVYAFVPEQMPEALKGLFAVASRDLRVDITTKILGRHEGRYNVVVDRSTGKIKFWQER